MKKSSYQFNAVMISQLESLIRKKVTKIKHDPVDATNSVYQIVGIYTDHLIIKLVNETQVVDYYGVDEDICLLKIYSAKDSEITSALENVTQISKQINSIIKEIHIINENQKLYKCGEQLYDIIITRGLIFVLEDGTELSFEKQDPFSEMISLNYGRNLIGKFSPTNAIEDNFSGNYCMKVHRNSIIIK